MDTEPKIYQQKFYESQYEGSAVAANIILSIVHNLHTFNSVLDVGCGVGTWLKAAQQVGAKTIRGVDGDYVDREALFVPDEFFTAHDLTQPLAIDKNFDLVISLEVAEHIPAKSADIFIQNLTAHGDLVLFSAALPYQGGTYHVNENWCEYWQNAFAVHGYEPVDILRDMIWHNTDIPFWYRQNICFFRARAKRNEVLPDHPATSFKSQVHPEFFLRYVRKGTGQSRFEMRQNRKYYRKGLYEKSLDDTPHYGSGREKR